MIMSTNQKLTDEILIRLDIERQVRSKDCSTYLIDEPIAFDIETTSFTEGEEEYSLCYIWQIYTCGICCYGRDLDEFAEMMGYLAKRLGLEAGKKHVVVYVHNLGFEFQFIHKYFTFKPNTIIANSARKVIRAVTENGIEFRCSYMLSGSGLANTASEIVGKKLEKSKDLDYSLIRHSKTPMTEEELHYCELDVKIVYEYIKERSNECDGLCNLPLTKTGYVRKRLKQEYMGNGPDSKRYREQMKDLVMTMPEYRLLRDAFMGGFTFCGGRQLNVIERNVLSFDINSSYPYEMFRNYYPVGNATIIDEPEKLSRSEIIYLLKSKCCVMDIVFKGPLKIKNENLAYIMKEKLHDTISKEKGWFVENRLFKLDKDGIARMTITEVDFYIINSLYDLDECDNMKIIKLMYYERGKLPRAYIKVLLDAYASKTKFKGDEANKARYIYMKTLLNALFGVNVQDPLRIRGYYDVNDQQWLDVIDRFPSNELQGVYEEELLTEYNNRRCKITHYPIGVYITAHARKNLIDAILMFPDAFDYADTDCIKFNMDDCSNAKEIIEYLNNKVIEDLKHACEYYNLPLSCICPKNEIKNEVKILGLWENDHRYKLFKSLGPKRYIGIENFDENILTEEEAQAELKKKPEKKTLRTTISGTSPYKLPEKFINECETVQGVFDMFKNGLEIQPEYTGKLTHIYIDDEQKGQVTDYLGNTAEFCTPSGIYMKPAEYVLNDEYSELTSEAMEDLFRYMLDEDVTDDI